MNQDIVKRLQVIKNLISLGELDIVKILTGKLLYDGSEEQLQDIIAELANQEFAAAALLIDDYLAHAGQILPFEDPELAGIRLQVTALEMQLAELSSRKIEIEKQLYYFNIRYQQELGAIILELLELKKLYRKHTAALHSGAKPFQPDEDYKLYENIFQDSADIIIPDLVGEQQQELRRLFVRASKLCHPDVVADEFKVEAEQTFIALKLAYEKNDLEQIRKILHILETGKMSTRSAQIGDKEKLKAMLVTLRSKIQMVEKEFRELKQSLAYRTLCGINDQDHYFTQLKKALRREISLLKGLVYG
ncbi:MAG TPA: hypothetical protein PLP19_15190 [bacterium]|nr:hypothetical protein [bacterium]HPN44835.1 hypothetical protein [bacterium]